VVASLAERDKPPSNYSAELTDEEENKTEELLERTSKGLHDYYYNLKLNNKHSKIEISNKLFAAVQTCED